MATAQISSALKAIPSKKEELRKAFEVLQSYSSSFSSFNLDWKDIDHHFSSIESSIDAQLKELESKSLSAALLPAKAKPSLAAKTQDEPEAEPRPELKTLCAKMDGKGLRSYINDNRKDLTAIQRELNPAIRSAPDPAALILDALEGFYHQKPKGERDGDIQAIRRTSINLLERMQAIAPEITPLVRDKAKKMALEWEGNVKEGDVNFVWGFLQLLAWYGLVSEFKVDELLDLVVVVSRRKQTSDLIKALGLMEKVPDLIQKLNSKGKQLESLKFVYAFELLDTHPPVPLLEDYLKVTKKSGEELPKHDANSKEIAALRGVIRAVEEYNLEAEYPPESLQKRVVQLEQQTASKKRTATAAAASDSKNQQRPTRRTRRSASHAQRPQMVHHQRQLGLTNHGSYLSLARPYAGILRAPMVPMYLHPSGPMAYGMPFGSSHYPYQK